MENDQSQEVPYVIKSACLATAHEGKALAALMIETVCLALGSLHGFGTLGFLLCGLTVDAPYSVCLSMASDLFEYGSRCEMMNLLI